MGKSYLWRHRFQTTSRRQREAELLPPAKQSLPPELILVATGQMIPLHMGLHTHTHKQSWMYMLKMGLLHLQVFDPNLQHLPELTKLRYSVTLLSPHGIFSPLSWMWAFWAQSSDLEQKSQMLVSKIFQRVNHPGEIGALCMRHLYVTKA